MLIGEEEEEMGWSNRERRENRGNDEIELRGEKGLGILQWLKKLMVYFFFFIGSEGMEIWFSRSFNGSSSINFTASSSCADLHKVVNISSLIIPSAWFNFTSS